MRELNKLILEAVVPSEGITHHHDGRTSTYTGPDGRTLSHPVSLYSNVHDDHMEAHSFLSSYPAETPVHTNTMARGMNAGQHASRHLQSAQKYKDFDAVDAVKSVMASAGHDHSHLQISSPGRGHVSSTHGQSQTVEIHHNFGESGHDPVALHDEPFRKALGGAGYRFTRGNYAGDGAKKTQHWSFDVWKPH